jgi:hypothetical protein
MGAAVDVLARRLRARSSAIVGFRLELGLVRLGHVGPTLLARVELPDSGAGTACSSGVRRKAPLLARVGNTGTTTSLR